MAELTGVSRRHLLRLAKDGGTPSRRLELVARLVALLHRGWTEEGTIAWPRAATRGEERAALGVGGPVDGIAWVQAPKQRKLKVKLEAGLRRGRLRGRGREGKEKARREGLNSKTKPKLKKVLKKGKLPVFVSSVADKARSRVRRR